MGEPPSNNRVGHCGAAVLHGRANQKRGSGGQPTNTPRLNSPHAASKLAGEIYCATYTRTFGLSTIALRYFDVFGPWQDPTSDYAAVIPKFIRLAKAGRLVACAGGWAPVSGLHLHRQRRGGESGRGGVHRRGRGGEH